MADIVAKRLGSKWALMDAFSGEPVKPTDVTLKSVREAMEHVQHTKLYVVTTDVVEANGIYKVVDDWEGK